MPPRGRGRMIHEVSTDARGRRRTVTTFEGDAAEYRRQASGMAPTVAEQIMLDIIARQRGGPTAIATNARLRRRFHIAEDQLLPLAAIYREDAQRRAHTLRERTNRA